MRFVAVPCTRPDTRLGYALFLRSQNPPHRFSLIAVLHRCAAVLCHRFLCVRCGNVVGRSSKRAQASVNAAAVVGAVSASVPDTLAQLAAAHGAKRSTAGAPVRSVRTELFTHPFPASHFVQIRAGLCDCCRLRTNSILRHPLPVLSFHVFSFYVGI